MSRSRLRVLAVPVLAAGLATLLSVAVASAADERARSKAVAVSTFTDIDSPFIFLSAGVDENDIGGVLLLVVSFTSTGELTTSETSYPLGPGDLVVNRAATKATLHFPAGHLTWTATGNRSTDREIQEVTRLFGVRSRARFRAQENDAYVEGVLLDMVINTQGLPLDSARINQTETLNKTSGSGGSAARGAVGQAAKVRSPLRGAEVAQ